MARPLRVEFPGAFYHVTSRGNERKAVFKSPRDREKFLSYLESATKRYGAVIHVYCLMDTHYHLFIETPSGNLSKIMQHINGAYTTYFNRKRERSGHLFQGRYIAILVEADEYAKELSRYIHLNPVRAGMVNTPEEYEWSSFRYYISKRNTHEWLKTSFLLGYFDHRSAMARREYKEFVHLLVGKNYESPLGNLSYRFMLGSEEFVSEIKNKYLKDKGIDRSLPGLRGAVDRPSIDMIEQAVDKEFHSDSKMARKVKIYLSHSYSGRKLREIGDYFELSDSGVTQASRRMYDDLKKDKTLHKKILKIKNNLSLC